MKTVEIVDALNILSSAAEEISMSDAEKVAEAFFVAPHGGVDLDGARRLVSRAEALSEALLAIQEEFSDVLVCAAERAEDRTGLRVELDEERYQWVDGLAALGEETTPVVAEDGTLLARLGTCPSGWVVVWVRGGVEPRSLFGNRTWHSDAAAECAVREKLSR